MSQTSSSSSTEKRNVIIVGAGIYGLVAAKTYLQINPGINLTVIDADTSVGGVWSASRVYAGLVTDLPSPAFELSDLQMSEEFGMAKWADIRGDVMHEYLERYAKKFDILRRVQFRTEVLGVERSGKGWKLFTKVTGEESGADRKDTMTCDKLLIATGLNSRPKMPDIDISAFSGIAIHSKDLHKRYGDITSETIHSVVVVGGNKSAIEAASACARAGKTVHWLIREDGAGAGMLMNATLASGKSAPEISLCRVMEYHSPTLYGYRGWWDRFYLSGKNKLGAMLFNGFWKKLTAQGLGDRYKKSENGKLLEPTIPNIFWSPTGLSVAHKNDLDFFDLLNKDRDIKISRTSIVSINGNSFKLSNGNQVEADAVVFATGWEGEGIPFFDDALKSELGLPIPKNILPPSEATYWDQIDAEGDKQIMDLYPIFATAPKTPVRERPNTQFRLLRTIIPPKLASKGDRSIVFLGQLANTQHSFFAGTSTLWAIAYLEGLLSDDTLGTKEDMDRKIALENAFMMRRYPGRKNIPWCVLEIRDWMDVMLKELGVRTDRGRVAWERKPDRGFGWWGWKAWFHEWFVAYEPVMYKGIVDEFLETVKGKRSDGTKVS
ncbi:FAD/NAD(P)-binding domain-containing protein [Cadophora sp. DSE1049]|nr:FAD/NAD(P)-binding domain-containing protein [Cadophora sp. DSE1049]